MNSLQTRIEADFLQAFKNKEAEKTSVLRMIKSSIKNAEIANKAELKEEDIAKLIQKEIKQRRDSILQYNQGNRPDLAAKEQAEIAIIEQYLPSQLSKEEIEDIVKKAISEVGAASKNDFGKVMGKIMPQVAGKADGKEVSAIVSSLLSND